MQLNDGCLPDVRKFGPWEGACVLRGRTYTILIALLLIGGGACAWGGPPLSEWHVAHLAAAMTFVTAAGLGIMGVVSSRKRMREVAQRVEKMVNQTRWGFIDAIDSESVPLIAAV